MFDVYFAKIKLCVYIKVVFCSCPEKRQKQNLNVNKYCQASTDARRVCEPQLLSRDNKDLE